jgi:hypothetical protein
VSPFSPIRALGLNSRCVKRLVKKSPKFFNLKLYKKNFPIFSAQNCTEKKFVFENKFFNSKSFEKKIT